MTDQNAEPGREYTKPPEPIETGNDGDAGVVESVKISKPEHKANPEIPPIEDSRAAIYRKASESRQAEAHPEPSADEEITVKINGEKRKVLKSKVDDAGGVEVYQKSIAANEGLAAVAARERAAREREIRIMQAEEGLSAREAQQNIEKTTPHVNSVDVRSKIADYHNAFMDGDLDKAGEIFAQIQEAQNATSDNATKAAEIALQRMRAERMTENAVARQREFDAQRNSAVQRFFDEEKDVSLNPDLVTLVDANTARILDENPDWMPDRIMSEAVKRVRQFRDGILTQSRTESKREMQKSLVHSTSTARYSAPPGPAPQTGSDYVAGLRKARGLE